jgi:hypothetical protein
MIVQIGDTVTFKLVPSESPDSCTGCVFQSSTDSDCTVPYVEHLSCSSGIFKLVTAEQDNQGFPMEECDTGKGVLAQEALNIIEYYKLYSEKCSESSEDWRKLYGIEFDSKVKALNINNKLIANFFVLAALWAISTVLLIIITLKVA